MRSEEIRTRLEEVSERMAVLHELESLTEDESKEFDELRDESVALIDEQSEIEARAAATEAVRAAAAKAPVTIERAVPTPVERDPFDSWEDNPAEWRGRAIDAIERAVAVDDESKAEAVRKIEGDKDIVDPQRKVARLVLATSSDAYRQAFVAKMAGRDHLPAEQRDALARAEEARTALQLTQSGYAVPAVVDPSVILTTDGVKDPMRGLARNVSITANQWKPVTSGGITASWDGEIAEVSDDTPTMAQPTITAYKAQAFAQGSIEFVEDWAAAGAELTREFADAKSTLEATAFISGTGSDQPIGLATALDGGTSEIDPATAETFAVADVYSTIEAVPPRHRNGNTAVMAELSTINAIRQFATANNYHAFLTDLGGGNPAQLLGYSLYENSAMDAYSDLDDTASADNFLILAGEFSNYVIVDRIGMSVEFIPHLFNTTTNLPDGRRGWYCHWRVGADSVNDNAFAMLSIPTTA